jgi:hypothetical protein
MPIKIVSISDGFASSSVPSVVDPQGAQVFNISLTSQVILAGEINLPATPNAPTQSILIWQGVGQQYGADFEIQGTKLVFLSRLLNLLLPNDFLVLYYQ